MGWKLDGIFAFHIEKERAKKEKRKSFAIPIKLLPDEINEGNAWAYYRAYEEVWNDRTLADKANAIRDVLTQYIEDCKKTSSEKFDCTINRAQSNDQRIVFDIIFK